MTTIADYRASVRIMIRDTNNASYAFTDPEIDAFTQAGASAYSRYRPRRKPYTLSLTANVAQYTLPADWGKVDLESFNDAVQPPSVVDASQFVGYALPTLTNAPSLSATAFDWYDSDQFVIVKPTPQGSVDISFAYLALHTIDSSTSTIPSADFDNVVLAAASRALDALAVDKGLKMQRYKIGQGLMIDDTAISKRLQEQAQTYWCRFEDSVKFRAFGVMG